MISIYCRPSSLNKAAMAFRRAVAATSSTNSVRLLRRSQPEVSVVNVVFFVSRDLGGVCRALQPAQKHNRRPHTTTARVHCQVKSGPVSRSNRAAVRLYALARTRTSLTEAPRTVARSPSMLVPSQQKDQNKIKQNRENPEK